MPQLQHFAISVFNFVVAMLMSCYWSHVRCMRAPAASPSNVSLPTNCFDDVDDEECLQHVFVCFVA